MTIKRAIYPVLAALLLPGLAYAQTNTVATFNVTKVFADGNVNEEVTVRMKCNNALILDGEDVISEAGGGVGFVAINFTPNTGATCTVTEDAEPGYTTSYAAVDLSGDEWADSAVGGVDGCVFTNLLGEDNSFFNCVITNTPKSVKFTVSKDWVLEGGLENFAGINTGYNIRLTCNNVTVPGSTSCSEDGTCRTRSVGSGGNVTDPMDKTFPSLQLTPNLWNMSSCTVSETVNDSVVETDVGCPSGPTFKIFPTNASGIECTVTNSVFFEGIPTLSQYGMAIMALLMLGVGFVGFRRFV